MAQKTDFTYLDIKAGVSVVEIDAETSYQFLQVKLVGRM